jgi:hypothetical protein
VSEVALPLFSLGTDKSHPLERFSRRLEFIAEQLNLAEEDLATNKDHIAATLDSQVSALWEALETLEREVVVRAFELGLLSFRDLGATGTT